MRTDRAVFTFHPNSWHARLYGYWQRNSIANIKNRTILDYADHPEGKAPYMENFCHYCRIILFWGPLTFLCRAPENNDFKAWMPFAFPVPFLAAAAAVFWLPFGTAMTLVMLAGVALFAGLLFFGAEYDAQIAAFLDRTLGVVFDKFCDGCITFGRFVKRTARRTVPFWKWWGYREIAGIWFTRAWMVIPLTAAGIAIWLFPGASLKFFALFGLGAAFGGFLLFAIRWASKRINAWEDAHPYERKEKSDEPSKFGLAYAFLAAKKHRVCPLIEFEVR